MRNIQRFTSFGSRLISVVGRRLCIGGTDHGYSSVPTRTPVPYKLTAKEMFDEWEKDFLKNLSRDSPQYKNYMLTTKKQLEEACVKGSQITTHRHLRTTQILDIFSVTIQSTTNNTTDNDGCKKEQKPFQIYGTIQLVDDDNDNIEVFRRRCNNPATILPGSNLLLTVPEDSHGYILMPMSSAYKMRLNLKDAATDGKVIAKGDFDLQMLGDNFGFCEKIVTKVVPSRNGTSACVQYAVLPHGVSATIQLTLTKIDATGSDQSESSHAHIYGCVSATTKVQKGSIISSVLFDKPPCDPMMVSLGTPIEFGRPKVAVPAYSSLQIKADLWDCLTNKKIASDVILANFQATDSAWDVQPCDLGQNYRARVKVFWNNAYELLEQEKKLMDERKISQSASSALSYRGVQLSNGVLLASFTGSPMVEVFSVTVSPDSDVNSHICGRIEVYDNKSYRGQGNAFVVFDRDKLCPVTLSGDMKIKSSSMKWPVSPFEGEAFLINLHLSDDEGREVCHGYIDWDVVSVNHRVSWFGKLLSSVILGKHGYATVHYAMFPDAIHADVRVKFRPKPSTQYQYMLVGNISAWYSSIKYPTYLEKKLFRSTLLTGDHAEMVSNGCSLILDKSSVAVPLNSSLILGMKFEVGIIGKTSEGPWFCKHCGSMDKVVDFEIDVGKERSAKTISGDGFDMDVVVKWIQVDRDEKMKLYQHLGNDLKRRFQEA